MTKEPRVIVRLIALWIIFMASVVLIFWSGQQFATSLVKIASGSYAANGCGQGYCPPVMTFTSCIMAPPYPMSSGMGAGMSDAPPMPVVDKGLINKYNQDYQKYTESYQKACEQDVVRQQGMQKNSSITDIAGYSVLLLLSVVAAAISLMAIRKSETEA